METPEFILGISHNALLQGTSVSRRRDLAERRAYVQIQQAVEGNRERNISVRPRLEERNEKREKGWRRLKRDPDVDAAFSRSLAHTHEACLLRTDDSFTHV